MAKFSYRLDTIFSLQFLLLLPLAFAQVQSHTADDVLRTYIVHVDDSHSPSLLASDEHRESWHKSFLPHPSRLLYSYRHAIAGFAARLTEEELAAIEKKPGFLDAHPDGVVPLHTTHTPGFLGLDRLRDHGLWKASDFGEGVIVGVVDTGVLPTHPSFDAGTIPPPPKNKWNGRCEFGGGGGGESICNNKLIGARNLLKGMTAMHPLTTTARSSPPYDDAGHGTHTASTAVGAFVAGANIEGQANGTAAGMAPRAHLAVYRACSASGCGRSDVVAAIDQAIADGVDVLSLSLGKGSFPYYRDVIGIAALAAVSKGIFVSMSAGNDGPASYTLANEAPWLLTVGATSVDRRFTATVTLGDGKMFVGESITQPSGYSSPSLPLTYPGSVSAAAAVCKKGSLDGFDVVGKIVVCDGGVVNRAEKGSTVKAAEGAGIILANVQLLGLVNTVLEPFVLPVSAVSYDDGLDIKNYIKSGGTPTASIAFHGTEVGASVVAPIVPYFSSRGPSIADPKILKPDIVGPGVNILAASPFKVGTPGTYYNMLSGTSMAAPHLSGIAALLRKRRPEWSPAAIKSAIMTTAYRTMTDGRPILDQNMKMVDFFATGAGHVDPTAASKPGLVYDLGEKDYIDYLCGLYTDQQVSVVARRAISCSDYKPITGSELNYPSFMITVGDGESVTVTRTVTNVGSAPVTYALSVEAPSGATMAVEPKELRFQHVNEKKEYSVTFTGKATAAGGIGLSREQYSQYSQGSLTWASTKFKVNSPIMVAVRAAGGVQSM